MTSLKESCDIFDDVSDVWFVFQIYNVMSSTFLTELQDLTFLTTMILDVLLDEEEMKEPVCEFFLNGLEIFITFLSVQFIFHAHNGHTHLADVLIVVPLRMVIVFHVAVYTVHDVVRLRVYIFISLFSSGVVFTECEEDDVFGCGFFFFVLCLFDAFLKRTIETSST